MITVQLEPTSLNELEAGLDLTKKESRAVLKGAINKAAVDIENGCRKKSEAVIRCHQRRAAESEVRST